MFRANGLGNATATAGTAINVVVPANPAGFTVLSIIRYVTGAAVHLLTILRVIGKTKTSITAASGQAVINLVADPGPSGNALAANDLLVMKTTTGTMELGQVSSVSGLAVTLTANLTGNLAAGTPVWNFGVVGDIDPTTGVTHPKLSMPANATTAIQETVGSLMSSHNANEPLIIQSNNVTAAGNFQLVTYGYNKE